LFINTYKTRKCGYLWINDTGDLVINRRVQASLSDKKKLPPPISVLENKCIEYSFIEDGKIKQLCIKKKVFETNIMRYIMSNLRYSIEWVADSYLMTN